MKLTTITILILTLLAGANVAFAQGGVQDGVQDKAQDGSRLGDAERPGRGGGLRGEVTAVGDDSLTVATRNGKSVTVNVTDETRIQKLDSGQGSLSDIEVGNMVGVRGQKNDNGSVQARIIVVLPGDLKDMDRVKGKVTAIEGEVIVVENRQGSQRITTNADTKFRIGREEGSLADIEVDHLVLALGEKQDDGFVAKVVIAATKDQVRHHTLHGKVLSVDVDEGVLTVETQGDKEGTWTINTTGQTKYRVHGIENPTLADVSVGAHVIVVGKADEDSDNTGTARLIAVVPEQVKGRVFGEVTAVIDDSSFILQSRQRGEFTILTDESTKFRTRGQQEVSFEDIKVGSKVIVVGEPVEGQDNTIKAKMVGLAPEQTD
ncbi:DUF5666 domain-containing protein [Chloroflexota bacterium]